MRRNPLYIHANTAAEFEMNGERALLETWLNRERTDITAEARQSIGRHVSRMIAYLGARQVNLAIRDLHTFELRLALTCATVRGLPWYAARHWRRSARNLAAAAYDCVGPEAQRFLYKKRPKLAQARSAGVTPFTVATSAQRASGASSPKVAKPSTAALPLNSPSKQKPTLADLAAPVGQIRQTLTQLSGHALSMEELVRSQVASLDRDTKIALVARLPAAETDHIRVGKATSVSLDALLDQVLIQAICARADSSMTMAA